MICAGEAFRDKTVRPIEPWHIAIGYSTAAAFAQMDKEEMTPLFA